MKKRVRASNDLRLEPGRASAYIKHAPEEIRPGDRVILCCRVSGHVQDRNGNLRDQEKNLRKRAAELGACVIDVETYVGSGRDAYWLIRPALKARERGAKLYAESTDRFIRHPDYHSKTYPDAQARDFELQELQTLTLGVPLLTDLHPDSSPSEVRGFQRRRGQAAKGTLVLSKISPVLLR